MVQKIFFLRHAQTQFDPSLHARMWNLSLSGTQQAKNLISTKIFQNITTIYCSEEKKTLQTIRPFAKFRKIPINIHPGLNEIHFSEGKPHTQEKFLTLKKHCFHNLDFSEGLLESFREGLHRFQDTIEFIRNDQRELNILIVSHGTVLTLYFASKLGILDQGSHLVEKWQNLDYIAWGLEQNALILRDLAQ